MIIKDRELQTLLHVPEQRETVLWKGNEMTELFEVIHHLNLISKLDEKVMIIDEAETQDEQIENWLEWEEIQPDIFEVIN